MLPSWRTNLTCTAVRTSPVSACSGMLTRWPKPREQASALALVKSPSYQVHADTRNSLFSQVGLMIIACITDQVCTLTLHWMSHPRCSFLTHKPVAACFSLCLQKNWRHSFPVQLKWINPWGGLARASREKE